MCLLTYFPEGSMPSMKDLENGAAYNDDGHGFAIVDVHKRQLIVRKSMDADILLELFEEMRAKHLDGPALFHSRIGTGGLVDKSNCHPFYIGGTEMKTVIAHNGILPGKAQPPRGDRRSDTRLLAEEFLPVGRFGAYHTRAGRKALGRWAGTGNKFAILSVDPRLGGHGFLVNGEQGEYEDGPTGPIWYSNSSHDASCWNYRIGGIQSGWWNDDYWRTGYTSGSRDISPSRETVTVIGGTSSKKEEAADDDDSSESGVTGLLYGEHEGREGYWYKSASGAWHWREKAHKLADRTCAFCASNEWVPAFPHMCALCLSCSVCAEWGADCSCNRTSDKEREYVNWWLQQEEIARNDVIAIAERAADND